MTEQFEVLIHRFGAPDARSLSPQARADLRRDVVVAVRGGMSRLEASRRYSVSRRTVGIWVRAYQPGAVPAKERPRGRPANPVPELTPRQSASVLSAMHAANPCVLGLTGQLWTRRTVADLIRIETGHEYGAACIEHCLTRWRLTVEAVAPEPGRPWMPDPQQIVPGSRTLQFSWHEIPAAAASSVPATVAGAPWQALVAESGHGGSHFRLPTTPVEIDTVRLFGRHLLQQVQRNVHLVVRCWPPDRADLLDAWQADPGPGLVITAVPVERFSYGEIS
ncbi:MAG TPA: hypothetical protein VHU88_12630 [Sporichthyaceae bacterium]|jgi:transposase|nr:hypothetical protein [Sporichthyaceae bacterium]